jgi:hypothetical protein
VCSSSYGFWPAIIGFLAVSVASLPGNFQDRINFFRNFAARFPEKELRDRTGSISKRVVVDFGAGQGARVHGRYPRGSRPWEERRGQHPDRCNSRTLPCCRICSVLTRSAGFITRSIFNRKRIRKLPAPESERRRKSNFSATSRLATQGDLQLTTKYHRILLRQSTSAVVGLQPLNPRGR